MSPAPVRHFDTLKWQIDQLKVLQVYMVFPEQLANLKSKENADARVVAFDVVSGELWTG